MVFVQHHRSGPLLSFMSVVSSQSLGVPSFPTSQVSKNTTFHSGLYHRSNIFILKIVSVPRAKGFVMSANNQEQGKVSSSQKKTTGSKGDVPRTTVVRPVFYTPDGKLIERSSLSSVVSDAVKRWYNEAEREASRGDVKAMALLGQMLMEGYGCDVDVERGKQLSEKARRRGYRMQRVYCEI